MAARAAHSDERLTTYGEIAQFLLQKYVTDNAIADTHNNVVTYKQCQAQTKTNYANKPYDKVLRCRNFSRYLFLQHCL